MNTFANGPYAKLYGDAVANSRAANTYMQNLSMMFDAAKRESGPGSTDKLLRLGGELEAYDQEAKLRHDTATDIVTWHDTILATPVDARSGCWSAPAQPSAQP